MNTTTFDTHQAVKAIADSGLNDTQAEVIVATINNAMHQNFATKSDIMSQKTELKSDIMSLKTELKTDIMSLKTELKSDIMSLETELKTDILAIKGEFLLLKWMVGLIIAVEILPLLKFLFV